MANIFSQKGDAQLKWLMECVPETSFDQLLDRAYNEPLGCYVNLNQYNFDDHLSYPEDYDLGYILQERLGLNDERAESINNGSSLTDDEKLSLTEYVIDQQLYDDDGISVAGFELSVQGYPSLFVTFTGVSIGQGGIEYEFAQIFESKDIALEYYRSIGDRWFDL